jgi:hypothetical protein
MCIFERGAHLSHSHSHSLSLSPPQICRPAFRGAEVITSNVVVGEDGHSLYSKCGTKLGTIENDATGSRHCIDLVCISGQGAQ